MPLCADPNETVPVYLDTDAKKPEEQRAAFLARHLTGRETRTVAALTQLAFDEEDGQKAGELLNQILAMQYAGWTNVADRDGKPIPFTVTDGKLATADDAMNMIDKWELVRRAVPATQLSHIEKKRLLLRLASPGEESAPNATPIDAATSPLADKT